MVEHHRMTHLRYTPPPFAGIDRADLTLRPEVRLGLGKVLIHGADAGKLFHHISGLPTPATGCQTEYEGLTTAWMAPGEWLLIGPEAAIAARLARSVERGGDAVLAVDLTHACAVFTLGGTQSRTALAAHCPLDLWDGAFPVGAVARSLLGDAGLFIARLNDEAGTPSFRIIVDQTRTTYVVRLLTSTPLLSGASS